MTTATLDHVAPVADASADSLAVVVANLAARLQVAAEREATKDARIRELESLIKRLARQRTRSLVGATTAAVGRFWVRVIGRA